MKRDLAASTKVSDRVYTLRTLHLQGDVKLRTPSRLYFQTCNLSKRYDCADCRTAVAKRLAAAAQIRYIMGDATFGIGILGAASIAKKNARAIAKCRNGAGRKRLLALARPRYPKQNTTEQTRFSIHTMRCKISGIAAVPACYMQPVASSIQAT